MQFRQIDDASKLKASSCRYCGCTDKTPCLDGMDEPCYWIEQPTRTRDGVCSNLKCVTVFRRDKKQAKRVAHKQARTSARAL